MTLNILNLEPEGYSDSAKQLLESMGNVITGPHDREGLLDTVEQVDVLIVRLGHRIDKEVMSHGKRLKVIVSATTGLNHIDLAYAAKKNIEVLSLKGETAFLETLTATAELTWMLLLTLVRKASSAINHVSDGRWQRDLFKGSQLQGKILGVIGYGRLGKIVADYGRAFKMEVIVNDPFIEKVPKWTQNVSLNELLTRADIVSLHVPLEQETVKLLSDEQFSLMKKGAILINTSRGEIIDERALLKSLKSGHLRGAGLDVISNEVEQHAGWPSNSELWQYSTQVDNVLITPHIGGATMESMEDSEIFMANKLSMYVNEISV